MSRDWRIVWETIAGVVLGALISWGIIYWRFGGNGFSDIEKCYPYVLMKTEHGQMLILSRRAMETILIGDDIKVVVLGIRGGQVRIGIDAPKNVPVHRQEVAERMAREAKATAVSTG